MKVPMKTTLMIPAAALLLAACASTTPDTDKTASAREERYTPIGTYLPRKKGQTANNAGTVSQTELENLKNSGNGAGAMTEGLAR